MFVLSLELVLGDVLKVVMLLCFVALIGILAWSRTQPRRE